MSVPFNIAVNEYQTSPSKPMAFAGLFDDPAAVPLLLVAGILLYVVVFRKKT